MTPSVEMLARYAELLVQLGVNLQPGQSLIIRAELAHAPLVRAATAAAYRAGARVVHVEWYDALTHRALLENADLDDWAFPAYETARYRQMVDEHWGRLALVGPEFPVAFDGVDSRAIRGWTIKRARTFRFYTEAMMANKQQWCVAAVPTTAWAQRIFPERAPEDAVAELWQLILRFVRADQADPVAAWNALNVTLKRTASFMAAHQVRSLHFLDPQPGPDGKPATDLVIGLTDRPRWMGGSSTTPAGVPFQPNMPTEEIFCTPHNMRTHGYVRTSRPSYPMQREVAGAWFRFENGEVVEFNAESGEDVLTEFLAIDGARRLGEVALVDAGSPIFQSGLTFYEILFDENAACHIAFGEAYPECVEGGETMTRAELDALGVNAAETHVDFMIGTPTMNVTGLCADGSKVAIMINGRFAPDVQHAG
jgi:aminopeptidase